MLADLVLGAAGAIPHAAPAVSMGILAAGTQVTWPSTPPAFLPLFMHLMACVPYVLNRVLRILLRDWWQRGTHVGGRLVRLMCVCVCGPSSFHFRSLSGCTVDPMARVSGGPLASFQAPY